MAYFALFYDVVDDFVARRAAYRDEHLKLANAAHERGEVVLAGALAEPVEQALIILRGDSPEIARAFAQKDPYVRHGLVKHWEVRPWSVAVGGEPAPAAAPAKETADMVVRFWSARTTQVRFHNYLEFFQEHVLPRLRGVEGFLEARVLSQSDGVVVQFIVETLWASMEAVDRFAGPDREAAVVAEEAVHLLTSYDRRVRHYHVEVREEHRATAASA